jgi:hypothetical protein
MSSEVEEILIEKVKGLPEAEQREVLEFVESLGAKGGLGATSPDDRPIWEVAETLAGRVPEEEWENLPADGAEQHDHYLYGAPKR